MQQLFVRLLSLLPVTLTIVPFPEMILGLYFQAPSPRAATFVFVLAWAASCGQMTYQYWAIGAVKRWESNRTSKIGAWLDRQPLVQAVRQYNLVMMFVFGLTPGVRPVGVALWRANGHQYVGGLLIALGSALQLAVIFASMLGLGRLVRCLFS